MQRFKNRTVEDKYKVLTSGWGYTPCGIALMRLDPANATETLLDNHIMNGDVNGSTMYGGDPVNNQLAIKNHYLQIINDTLVYQSPIPNEYSNTRVLFNPAEPYQAIMSPLASTSLKMWDLDVMQPDFSLNLPLGTTWAGRGQFSSDGARLLVLVNATPNNGVVLFEPPLQNPYTISSPVSGATMVSLTPLIQVSSLVNLDAKHQASQWQVRRSNQPADYSATVFDSGKTTAALTSIALPANALEYSNTYFARMRYRNDIGIWSEWSSESGFTTIMAPAQPVNASPANGALGIPLTPMLEASAFFDGDPGITHAASQWQARLSTTPANYSVTVWDSGITTDALTSATIAIGTLNYNATYYWRARYEDNRGLWSAWSNETGFSTLAYPDTPMNLSPEDNASWISLTPTLQASPFIDRDPGDTHQASQWQIRDFFSPSDYIAAVYDSGTTATALTSLVLAGGILDYSTLYYWRVRYQDSHGFWSAWSAETLFTTTTANGEVIIFVMNGDIWRMRSDGSELMALTTGPAHDGNSRFNHAGPRIAFSSDRDGQYHIWTMTPDGGGLQRIEGFQSGNPIGLDWSPDDQQLVVGAQGDAFWIVNADGSGATRLTQHLLTQARQVAWSAQNLIALVLSPVNNPAVTAIRAINANGTGERQILDNAAWPTFSPLGSALLFSRNGDLWTANPDGTNMQNLISTAEEIEDAASYSADGTKIYYRSAPSVNPANSSIYARPIQGGVAQLLYHANAEITSLDAAVIELGTNYPPLQPVNQSPADGATSVILTPMLQSSAFNDPDAGDTHGASRWQIRLASGSYDTAVLDRTTTTGLISYSVPASILVPGQIYGWRARHIDNHGNASAWSLETTISTIPPTVPLDKILIIAGGGDYLGNPIVDQTKFLAGYAYRLSLTRQVPRARIHFLSAYSTIDADGDGGDDVDASATRANILNALNPSTGWTADTDKLIVYLVDHGSRDGSDWYFRINPTEVISAAEVDQALDTLQAAHPGLKVALVCDFCYSGGFVARCQPSLGQNRIVISGSTQESLAIFNGTIAGVSFSNFFFDSLASGASFKMAFNVARDGILAAYVGPPSYPQQVPWLEDNWDGSISDKFDGVLAATFYWGSTAAYGATPPTILAVTADQTLPAVQCSLKLQAELAPGHAISPDGVWANIIPPNANYAEGEPVTNIIRVPLVREGNTQIWSAVYDGFIQKGAYRVTFFAKGSDGGPGSAMLANPRMSMVQRLERYNAAGREWTLY